VTGTGAQYRGDRPAVTPIELTRPESAEMPLAAFTVDVEDWYQSCVDFDAPITERVVRNVERLLELLDEAAVKATFFVQGRVAETFPKLVRDLIGEGHEIQSHGYSHKPLSKMSRSDLRDEIERSKKVVEDAAGTEVTAFRAQDFSIGESNLWALETLSDVGFAVDSSIFPMRGASYGIPGWPVAPHRLTLPNGSTLLEVPVAIWERARVRLPVAGGGYFRLLPRGLIELGLRSITAGGRPAVIYCHPYEFGSNELAGYKGEVGLGLRFSQGLGRGALVVRMRKLLRTLPFGRFDAVLAAWGVA
jgi:polysaccharide deacetylase family protein (PEP-CTERM system associated)